MKYLRLKDPLLGVLFENEEVVAIDKPYGFKTHANDIASSQISANDEGLLEIYKRQLNCNLLVVHRLDQTTTGVLVFAKNQEAAKKYAEYFLNKEVQKTYIFITNKKISKERLTIENEIVYKGKSLEARTHFNLIKRSKKYDVWQARPETGRNHQIRIHAKDAGLNIIGDVKYDGTEYNFLCLHNQQIEFPNGLKILSKKAAYYENPELLEDELLAKCLFETDRRQKLFCFSEQQDQCLRLAHCKNDYKKMSFTIDQFGSRINLSVYDEKISEQCLASFQKFAEYISKPVHVRLMFNRGKDPLNKSQFIIKPENLKQETETIWNANEGEIQYEIRSDLGQSFGLFLDQRTQRNWILKNSKNKSVLNLFSYTCGFSVVAAKGGAKIVNSVDTSKSVLNWGKRNFELNNIDLNQHKFLLRDSLEYLEYCQKKNIKFDIVICDPPSFSRSEKGVFKIENKLEILLKLCLRCLNQNGKLLFSTNFENTDITHINNAILKIKKELNLTSLEISQIASGLDFEIATQKSILKSFLISV